MSVLGTIFAILGFLISPFGLFAVLLGFLAFFTLPVLSKATSYQKPSNLFLWLAKQPINRAAIVVDEHNGIHFKNMVFDSLGVEKITLDGETKVFEDPDSALHYWLGLPFALADEKHGVLFDPRHAVLGSRKAESDERDESNYNATTEEWENFEVSEWHKGVFEMPYKYELANLSNVRQLVDGGERSEYAKRVEELYRHSRDPFGSGTPMTKFFYPIVGFAVTFFGIWFMSSQFGGGSMPTSSVSWAGGLLYILASTAGDENGGLNVRTLAKAIIGVVGTLAPFIVLALFINPIIAIAVYLALGIGFLCVPVLSQLSRPSATLSGAFSKLFFRLGFMGFNQPVFVWTPEEYKLREFSELDDVADVTWYGLFGSKVGFTFIPNEGSWGAETMENEELKSRQVVADGGEAEKTNLPSKFVKTNTMTRDGYYGAFIPKRIKDSKYYLHTGIATARFNHSAVGQKALRRLLQAKEEFGEDQGGMSDETVFKTTAVAGLFGVILGVLFFVL